MKNKALVNVTNGDRGIRGNYAETLEDIQREGFCPFCESNLKKHHSKPILFKNKDWIVTANAWPYEGAKHHFLLISKIHVEKAEDATPEAWKNLGVAYKRIIKEYSLDGASLFMRSGNTERTGASVQHLHAQIIVGSKRKPKSKRITATLGFQK